MKLNLTLVLIITVFCFLKFDSVKAQVNVQDSLALVDLYNSTNGPGWYNHTNWLTTAPVSTWFGVEVYNNRVLNLYLHDNLLTGSIPFSFGNLSNLNYCILGNNQLTGSIPSSLGKLKNLTALELYVNGLSGNIPSSLNNAINLVELDMHSNNFGGHIPSFSNLTLVYLDLSNNNLSGNIENLAKQKHLEWLGLSSNKLEGGISVLRNFDSLSFLFLSNNRFTGDITPVNTLSDIYTLFLDHNKFSGRIPDSLGKLNVAAINLSYNKLTGNIPVSISLLKSAWSLNLSNNKLTDTISNFSKLTNLEELNLGSNMFTFESLERIADSLPFAVYSPQAFIHLNKVGNKLSISAGGTLSNNTYSWYRNGALFKTVVGDSILHVGTNGKYSVRVINSIATSLTLQSDTVNYTSGMNMIASSLNIQNNLPPVLVYPNPVKTTATILFNTEGKYTIIITDISGKILQTKTSNAVKNLNTIQLDVSKYANGTYIISVINEQNKQQSFTINKQ